MIDISMSVNVQAADEAKAEVERDLTRALDEALDRLLQAVAEAQVLSYTASANPTQPAGTRYERTFTLQDASRIERTGRTLSNMSGAWFIDEGVADYGPYVVGQRSEQATIHQNRWKSVEDVTEEITKAAPGIIIETLEEFNL